MRFMIRKKSNVTAMLSKAGRYQGVGFDYRAGSVRSCGSAFVGTIKVVYYAAQCGLESLAGPLTVGDMKISNSRILE
jgi:hypothetical protein